MPRCKHITAFSGGALPNVVPAACLDPRDARAASLPRTHALHAPFDARHNRDPAFARAAAAGGWSGSTALASAGGRRRELAALDAAATAHRAASPPPRAGGAGSRTLVQRETEFAAARRAEKEAVVARRRGWERRFGADGAAAMELQQAKIDARRARATTWGSGSSGSSGSGVLRSSGGGSGGSNGDGWAGSGGAAAIRIKPTAEDLLAVAALPDAGLLPAD